MTTALDCHGRRTRVGHRIRLVATADPYTRLQPGDLGTVTRVARDPWSVILGVTWDSGSTLGLCADEDMWAVVPELCTCGATSIFHGPGCPLSAHSGRRPNNAANPPRVVDTDPAGPVGSTATQDAPS